MKVDEFIKKVEDLGYTVKEYEYCYCIRVDDMNGNKNYGFAYVGKVKSNNMEICPVSENGDVELFNIMVEYASTPINERGEEVKYYLRQRPTLLSNGILNYSLKSERWFYDCETQTRNIVTEFTEKEIEELGYKLNDFAHCVVGTDEWLNK